MTRAIVIAAGRGKRLGAHTEELPKCLVQVGALPILGWQLKALSAVLGGAQSLHTNGFDEALALPVELGVDESRSVHGQRNAIAGDPAREIRDQAGMIGDPAAPEGAVEIGRKIGDPPPARFIQ